VAKEERERERERENENENESAKVGARLSVVTILELKVTR